MRKQRACLRVDGQFCLATGTNNRKSRRVSHCKLLDESLESVYHHRCRWCRLRGVSYGAEPNRLHFPFVIFHFSIAILCICSVRCARGDRVERLSLTPIKDTAKLIKKGQLCQLPSSCNRHQG